MATRTTEADEQSPDLHLVDCDIHVVYKEERDVAQHLPRRYRKRGVTLSAAPYANPTGNVIRQDVVPDEDRRIARDRPFGKYSPPLESYQEHLLDAYDIEYGIITGYTNLMGLAGVPNRDYAGELARAANEWIREEWLSADDRFVGSILVAPQNPDRSVELIEEYADDPNFVQTVMSTGTQGLLGRPQFWPIYEAAEDAGLPVALHSGISGPTLTQAVPGGVPATYFEFHNQMPLKYMAHLNSLVCEGVFVEYPDLHFVFIEGGIAWLPHLLWRMDKNWKGLRTQAPWLERPPSEYVLNHVRLTTQPIEEPPRPVYLNQIFEMIDAERTVMFSSDFPHWDGDSPTHGLPNLPPDLKRRILSDTARELYDLPER